MSVRVLGAVWRVDCKPVQKLLLLALADHTNDETMDCWPSLTHLQKKTGLARSTIVTELNSMEESGLIDRVRGDKKSTRYIMKIENWSDYRTSTTTGLVRPPDHTSPTTGPVLVRPPDPKHNLNHQRNVNGNVSEPSFHVPSQRDGTTCTAKNAYPLDFEKAWSAYPKRAGSNSKALALKAWKARIKSGVDPGVMLRGVMRYAAFVRATGKEGTEYVQQAATFFGPGEYFVEEWDLPQEKRSSAMPEWL